MPYDSKKHLLFSFLIVLPLLSACTSTSHRTDLTTQERIKIVASKFVAPDSETFVLDVPAPDDSISSSLMVATLKMGGSSNAIESLVEVLMKVPNATIVVTGSDDEVTVATIEAALKQLARPSFLYAKTRLVFAGNPEKAGALIPLSNQVGINFEVLPYP